jgi:hypothetical protein
MKRDDRSIHWQTVFALWLALTLILPAMAFSAETKPQAPGCQTEVVDRGKRLGVGHYLPGIKIWRLDLHKIGPSGKPIYQYTIKDSRDCWIVVEGVNLEVTTFLDLFYRITQIPPASNEIPYDSFATRSLFALWEQNTKERCGEIDSMSSTNKQQRTCLRRSKISNLKRGHSISVKYGLDRRNTRISIFTQNKKIWGIDMTDFKSAKLWKEPLIITYIYDVDLVAANP